MHEQLHLPSVRTQSVRAQCVRPLKSADDTILIALISEGDASVYRWEIDHLLSWCGQNKLSLNAFKTVEKVVSSRKNSAPTASF